MPQSELRPNNQPGYIRIDSVHQGDQDKRKGVYPINAVDEVTQFQVIVTVERISERFMLPALKLLLAVFPFKIRGFHADNGGEHINYTVAELLDSDRSNILDSGLGNFSVWLGRASVVVQDSDSCGSHAIPFAALPLDTFFRHIFDTACGCESTM